MGWILEKKEKEFGHGDNELDMAIVIETKMNRSVCILALGVH